MNQQKESTNASSIILGLLGIAFIVLKLCGVITWSWWWVLAPFWGGLALGTIFFLVIILIHVFTEDN